MRVFLCRDKDIRVDVITPNNLRHNDDEDTYSRQ